jgi:hypothetical protein
MVPPYVNRLVKSYGWKTRVLDLHSAAFSSPDPIYGALREISLDGSQKYEALSYVWGTDNPSIPVHLGNATLLVTRNCHSALRRLRDTKGTRTLWVDSICINQSDEEEKSHQVAIMRDIFANAHRVYIWLGERTEESDYALDWCVDVSREVYGAVPKRLGVYLPMKPWDIWESFKVVLLKRARHCKLSRNECLPSRYLTLPC